LDSWDPDGADRAPEASPRARMDDSSAP
jgi:hypothetical protein